MEHQNTNQCWQRTWFSNPQTSESWHDLLQTCATRAETSASACPVPREGADETEGILFSLAKAVEQRDLQTAGHCERLAFISVALGVAIGLHRKALVALYRGGYLHDVGKIGIPDSILFKPGRLSAQEWETMRSHSARGEEICRPLRSLDPVLPIIRHHHERWDGSGYPDGLKQEQIPLLARVVQMADIYDALTSPRPYKSACPPQQALEIMADETARGWRDPRIFRVFVTLHLEVIAKLGSSNLDGSSVESMSRSLLNLRTALRSDSQDLVVSNNDPGLFPAEVPLHVS